MIDENDEPFNQRRAMGIVRKIYAQGLVLYDPHLLERMKERNILEKDVTNVLTRGWIYEAAEYENGSYRYRVETNRYWVRIAFDPPATMVVITAVEKKTR